MAGGIIEKPDDVFLYSCECNSDPIIVWHYIRGTANRIHYFVKCPNCNLRTRDRRKVNNAIKDWNNEFYR